MLKSLKIKDLAVVTEAELDFAPGYNVITGETGAGKSILIDGLMLALGERADRGLVRTGADRCLIEVVFDFSESSLLIKDFLRERGFDPNEPVNVRRMIMAEGGSKQAVNGVPVGVAVLRDLGNLVVDFHGPYEHQSLLDPGKQLQVLDEFGGLHQLQDEYTSLVLKHESLMLEKERLIQGEEFQLRQLDYLRHQIEEIENAHLKPNEDIEIEQSFRRLNNAARINELGWAIKGLLGTEEGGVMSSMGRVGRLLREINSLDPSAETLVEQHAILTGQISEFAKEVERYLEKAEFDPQQYALIESRYNQINLLKKKYGPTLNDVFEHLEKSRSKLQEIEMLEKKVGEIDAELSQIRKTIMDIGFRLSEARRKVAPELIKSVLGELRYLGFKAPEFQVVFKQVEVSDENPKFPRHGFEEVEFMFTANLGEVTRPLRQVVSSGELARVMLALKVVLAACDQVPVLVFDEVDANIGGETGLEVGRRLRAISRARQVICITHLPQVAAFADKHFVVTKVVKSGKTEVNVKPIDYKGRIEELARMLGGQTETARKHAETLLKLQ